MLKKIVLGVATAFAVTLAAGSMTTTANAAEFSLTISDGYGGRSHAIHDRGRRGQGQGHRGYRRGHRDGNWGNKRNDRRGGWRHTRYNDGYGRGHRRHGRDVCRVVKKIIIFEDAYGNRTRKVRRHRTCGWGRR